MVRYFQSDLCLHMIPLSAERLINLTQQWLEAETTVSTEDQEAALRYVHSGRSLDRTAWVSFVRLSVWLCDRDLKYRRRRCY